MSPAFQSALSVCFVAMAKVFLIGLIGFALVRRGALKDEGLGALVRLTIDVLTPASLIMAFLKGFSAERLFHDGAPILIFVVAWILGSGAICYALLRALRVAADIRRRSAVALASIQNSSILLFPLTTEILPPDLRVRGLLYMALAVLATSLIQWTWGTMLIRGDEAKPARFRENFSGLLNAPVLSIFAGLALAQVPALAEAARGAPDTPAALEALVGAANMLDAAMGPVASLTLGGLIGSCHFTASFSARHSGAVILTRLVLSPVLVYFALGALLPKIDPLVAFAITLQAASPSAMNLGLAARRFGGDWGFINANQLPTYLLALITLPLWAALALAKVAAP